MRSEHYEKRRCSENVLQKIVKEKKFPDITAEETKIENKTIRNTNSAELIK